VWRGYLGGYPRALPRRGVVPVRVTLRSRQHACFQLLFRGGGGFSRTRRESKRFTREGRRTEAGSRPCTHADAPSPWRPAAAAWAGADVAAGGSAAASPSAVLTDIPLPAPPPVALMPLFSSLSRSAGGSCDICCDPCAASSISPPWPCSAALGRLRPPAAWRAFSAFCATNHAGMGGGGIVVGQGTCGAPRQPGTQPAGNMQSSEISEAAEENSCRQIWLGNERTPAKGPGVGLID
jgi:hypothetical protein